VDTFGAGGMRAHRLNDQELLVFIRSGAARLTGRISTLATS
jgi:hypothetical protein